MERLQVKILSPIKVGNKVQKAGQPMLPAAMARAYAASGSVELLEPTHTPSVSDGPGTGAGDSASPNASASGDGGATGTPAPVANASGGEGATGTAAPKPQAPAKKAAPARKGSKAAAKA